MATSNEMTGFLFGYPASNPISLIPATHWFFPISRPLSSEIGDRLGRNGYPLCAEMHKVGRGLLDTFLFPGRSCDRRPGPQRSSNTDVISRRNAYRGFCLRIVSNLS